MEQMMSDLIEFSKAGKFLIQGFPSHVDEATKELRKNLIEEEHAELQKAIEDDDLVEIADACIDLMYVIIGTLVAYGIDGPSVWKLVQNANMKKFFTVDGKKIIMVREDGKVLKPENWQDPNPAIEALLAYQDNIVEKYGKA